MHFNFVLLRYLLLEASTHAVREPKLAYVKRPHGPGRVTQLIRALSQYTKVSGLILVRIAQWRSQSTVSINHKTSE